MVSGRPNVDLREVGTYTLRELHHYLNIPYSTLRAWFHGQSYGHRSFRPVFELADQDKGLASFYNLVEAHVLGSVRREIKLPKMRKAIEYLKRQFHSRHPLTEHEFETDGLDLFVKGFFDVVAVTGGGQIHMRQILECYLRRVDREKGRPIRLYPFTRKGELQEPRAVVIDPLISFGRPVLAGKGITTAIVAERYKAGESIEELADDYGMKSADIEEAIRCELPRVAA